MIYSAGCEYAIRALTRLTIQAPNGGFCLLRDIVGEDSLPEHFVGKLLQSLVRSEILVSAKGRGGGFALKVPPGEVRLRQIVEAIDGSERIGRCILGLSACDEKQPCPQHDGWYGIRAEIDKLLDNTTLRDLADAMLKKQGQSEGAGAREK